MEPNQPSVVSERRRAADVAAVRRRQTSVAIGAVGLIVLFGGAFASLLLTSVGYGLFIGLEIAGLALIVVSLGRLKRSVSTIHQTPKGEK